MVVRTAGLLAIKNKENVPGVVLKDTAVEKTGKLEMVVMAHLAELTIMNVIQSQVNNF